MKSATSLVTGLIGGFLAALILLVALNAWAPYPVEPADAQAATLAAAKASLNYYKPKGAARINMLIEGKAASPEALVELREAITELPISSDPNAACSPGSANKAAGCQGSDFLDAHFVSIPFLYLAQVQIQSRACTQLLMLVQIRGKWYPNSSKLVCNKALQPKA